MQMLRDIAARIEEEALRGEPVATCAAGLLVVPLDVFREVGVHNEANIRFVDSHTERDGRADDSGFVAQKRILVAGAFSGVKSGVVRTRRVASVAKSCCHRFRTLARLAIDDAGVVRPRLDKREKLCRWFVGANTLCNHAVVEIGSVKARDKDFGIAKS